MNDGEDDAVTTVSITVSRVITPGGAMAVRIKLPEEYSMVEILGLLEAAKCSIFNGLKNDTI